MARQIRQMRSFPPFGISSDHPPISSRPSTATLFVFNVRKGAFLFLAAVSQARDLRAKCLGRKRNVLLLFEIKPIPLLSREDA